MVFSNSQKLHIFVDSITEIFIWTQKSQYLRLQARVSFWRPALYSTNISFLISIFSIE